jgi:hypothetical protein
MIRIEKMIMIGATARQSGKTELASRIIEKYCQEVKITGIKVTTVQKGDAVFHGSIALPPDKNYIIEKNSVQQKNKSTDRMLAAGAIETYWVHSRAEYLEEAIQQVLPLIDKNVFIVCESNSLRKLLEPGVFIVIKNLNKEIKDSVKDILEKADVTVNFNGNEFINFDLCNMEIKDGRWVLNN